MDEECEEVGEPEMLGLGPLHAELREFERSIGIQNSELREY